MKITREAERVLPTVFCPSCGHNGIICEMTDHGAVDWYITFNHYCPACDWAVEIGMTHTSSENFDENALICPKCRTDFNDLRATIPDDAPTLVVQAIIRPHGSNSDGQLIRAVSLPWQEIIKLLAKDWRQAYRLQPRYWEELVAASFDQAGYDEVTLTPRSGDHGRDIIAVKRGVGSIRIIDSVKVYKPGNLVRYDDVRALLGVLHGDHQASKAILTTTSDFPPQILNDKFIASSIPYRLELMNGDKLRKWLTDLSKTANRP